MTKPRAFPEIDGQLLSAINVVEPSFDGVCHYRPCTIELAAGDRVERVLCVRADEYRQAWGPGGHGRGIDPTNIRGVTESKLRLPARFANRLYEVGESGMGYVIYTIVLCDGRKLPRCTGNVVDFPALPRDISSEDIQDVVPGVGHPEWRNREPTARESSATHGWFVYEAP